MKSYKAILCETNPDETFFSTCLLENILQFVIWIEFWKPSKNKNLLFKKAYTAHG